MAKHKAKITLAGAPVMAHDRRAADLLQNAKVAPIIVDDPYQAGEKIVVFRSLRDDTLAVLHNSHQIDQAQFMAGRHWQRAYELSEVGGARAIDPTKEAVDGGGGYIAGITDAQSKAFASLKKATQALGMEGEALVMDVLGTHLTLDMAATKRGLMSQAERVYLGRRFREALETLAVVYNYAMPGPRTQNRA